MSLALLNSSPAAAVKPLSERRSIERLLLPLHRQVEAAVAALRTILVEYRYLMAIAQSI